MTARHWFGARPFRRSEGPPKRARRGDTAGSPSRIRFDIGDGNLTRFGCPSLKIKTLDCTRRPEHAARHRCTRLRRRQRRGVRHEQQDPPEAHPITRPWRVENQGYRYGESRREVQTRRFAKPKSSMGLRPKLRRRAPYVRLRCLEASKPQGTTTERGTCQRSSSESNSSRGGSAGFPTGNASRRNVSRKVGEAE